MTECTSNKSKTINVKMDDTHEKYPDRGHWVL